MSRQSGQLKAVTSVHAAPIAPPGDHRSAYDLALQLQAAGKHTEAMIMQAIAALHARLDSIETKL